MIKQEQIDRMSLADVIEAIISLNASLDRTWTSNGGWGSGKVAEILDRSRLDRQVSLSECLRYWAVNPMREPLSDGQLILAWANLGAMIEGTLKLFLALYHHDYETDADASWKGTKLEEPDGLMLDRLRRFCAKKRLFNDGAWDPYIFSVQQKRNAIHAFQAKDIGTTEELHMAIRLYLAFLRVVADSLPDPPPDPRDW